MTTWHIHIEGQVQGVGFRPYVFLLAKQHNLNGWVINTTDGVHIEINAAEKSAHIFYKQLLDVPPALSRITSQRIYQTQQKVFDRFEILQSETAGTPNLLLAPDFAICSKCKHELHTPQDRREGYPFITCTNCGPRFSIIKALPYDRMNTSMAAFKMCPACAEEYNAPLNRRYYSQTNSCPDCSIRLSLLDSGLHELAADPDDALEAVVRFWKEGKIVAIKGIGGYLLTCDAANKKAIQELRFRKHRPTKPFALMYPNIEMLEKVAYLQEEEAAELESPAAPIVLLKIKEDDKSGIIKEEIAPGLSQVGVMLPYAPLYQLLLQKFGKPIVATSGNISNSPILFEDEKALDEIFRLADFILFHNRDIAIPQDDSVVRFTPIHKHRIVLRRSRGVAPTYINPNLKLPERTILATGAMLKSTFSLLHRGNTFISQYLGDLDQFDAQVHYEHTLRHFLTLFDTQPGIIVADKHPQYASTLYGKRLAQELNIPFRQVQHHLAHFGSVLGENDLVHSKEPVLGVIWDGTGYGDDGQIWGGEFFRYEDYSFSRAAHFNYFDHLLGDKMAKEPRVSALASCWNIAGAEAFLKEKFSENEWQLYNKMLQKGSALKTSSVGRIFDAVGSLLGVMDVQNYEGEAALKLETLACKYFKKNKLSIKENYFLNNSYSEYVPTEVLMSGVIKDLKEGKSTGLISAKLHFSLVELVRSITIKQNISKITFSGGVFQNSLLVDLISHHLKEEFELYFHKELSPNDENVSFGQLVCYQILNMKR